MPLTDYAQEKGSLELCVAVAWFVFFLEKIVRFLTEYYSDSGDDVGKIYVYAEQLVCVYVGIILCLMFISYP